MSKLLRARIIELELARRPATCRCGRSTVDDTVNHTAARATGQPAPTCCP